MTRLFLWFGAMLIAAYGAAWFTNNPGVVTIDFQGARYYTDFARLALIVGALALTTGLLVWLIGWLKRDMPLVGSNQIIKRQARGIKMLNQSLVALSAGDHKLAGRLVGQAEVLLPPQPMVHLIAAEAAQRGGDHAAAAKRYKALEQTEDGRLLGLRGLLAEARRTGRESEALRLARTAFGENRKSPWVLKTLFALEVAAGNWTEANGALSKVLKEGLLDADTGKRHQAALAYAEATEENLKGNRAAARKGFKKTLSHRPEFSPATVALARLELADNHKKKAEKILTAAWQQGPHPSYAKLFKELDLSESKADWLKRVRAFITTRPEHPESLLLLTDALMDATEYEAAKPVLDKLIKDAPSREAWQYRLALAHVLKEDPDPIEAALHYAEDGALWQCNDCGHKPHGWSPLCANCDAFDTTDWKQKGDLITPAKAFDADTTIALIADTE
ncbi:MAG: tetratricopeptide repeat protein [Kordiimonadaceae bacterium]|nr:tetratricopeptide repeat protein [Kordiimonadaceae bacterium]